MIIQSSDDLRRLTRDLETIADWLSRRPAIQD